MKIFSRFPVFRFLLPFTSGVLYAIHFGIHNACYPLLALISFFVAGIFTVKNYASGKYAQRWLAGIPFYCCFFSLGCCLLWMSDNIHRPHHFQKYKTAGVFAGLLVKDPVSTEKGHRFILTVIAVRENLTWYPASGKLAVFIHDSKPFSARRGNTLLVKGNAVEIPPPSNPGSFDARMYNAAQGAWYQLFAEGDDYLLTNKKKQKELFSYADQLRDIFLEKLKRHLGKEDLGVAGALLLGYEDWLDPELENSWSGAGVLHVLCVSGMHVMLIYVILAGLLSWMEKNKWLRHLRYILLLTLIWFYAMVTGFSPSVIRAAAMLSLVCTGKWMNREASIYNLMCSSCFLLFIMEPRLVMSAGFRLSFLAVCGIIFLHPLILSLWTAPGKISHKIWELISISSAAQLATFPLSLLLFHQFPNYFLLANLLIIPLSTLVMYSGLLLLVTDWIPYAGLITGTVTSWGIKLLNFQVVSIGNIPGAVTTGVYINTFELLLLYALLFSITSWLVTRNNFLLMTALTCMVIFLSIEIHRSFETLRQQEFVVFDCRGTSLIAFISGRKATLITDQNHKPKTIRYATEEYLVSKKICERESITLNSNTQGQITNIISETVVFLKGNYKKPVSFKLQSRHSVIIGKPVPDSASEIIKEFNPGIVILDGSCSLFQVQKLSYEFRKMKIPVYSVSRQGAYIYSFRSATDF